MPHSDLSQISQIELIYKRKVKADDRPFVSSSNRAHILFRQNWNDLTINLIEEFKILLLDRSNRCMGIASVSKGGVTSTVADPKIVFMTALKARATGIICAHNHPSGNLKPSQQDIALTRKLVRGGQYLDIDVTDHLVLTQEGYYSMVDNLKMP